MPEEITGDDKEYRIRPIRGHGPSRDSLTFDVKCRNDAHIALLSGDIIAPPMIEVFIGGWGNTKSAIRMNQTRPDKVEAPTPGIVTEEEHRRFWIRFQPNSPIQVGRDGDEEPFLVWDNTNESFKVSHFAFATGWGSSGSWIFDDEEKNSSASEGSEDEDPEKIRQRGKKPFYRRPGVWLDVKDGKMPMRAVLGGIDTNGEKVYVGRVKREGALLPGKIVPSHGCCYITCGGTEYGSEKYQVLVRNKCCELAWVRTSDGGLPLGALQGGYTSDTKNPIYIGRAVYDGATTIGMVNPDQECCTCPYGGEALCQKDYEVLVVKCIPL